MSLKKSMIFDIVLFLNAHQKNKNLIILVVLKIEESSLWLLILAKITEASSFVCELAFSFCLLPYALSLDHYQMAQSIFSVLFSITGKI